jgi:hypothetical protein
MQPETMKCTAAERAMMNMTSQGSFALRFYAALVFSIVSQFAYADEVKLSPLKECADKKQNEVCDLKPGVKGICKYFEQEQMSPKNVGVFPESNCRMHFAESPFDRDSVECLLCGDDPHGTPAPWKF